MMQAAECPRGCPGPLHLLWAVERDLEWQPPSWQAEGPEVRLVATGAIRLVWSWQCREQVAWGRKGTGGSWQRSLAIGLG